MSLEFMKPTVWDGLVIGITVIGLALAAIRLVKNRAAYRQQRDSRRSPDKSTRQ